MEFYVLFKFLQTSKQANEQILHPPNIKIELGLELFHSLDYRCEVIAKDSYK